MEITGSGALVTGGASGLGEATARHLVSRGAHVTIFDMNSDRAAAVAEELGGGTRFAVGDVTSEADTAAAIEVATTDGPLRIVVACAGGARGGGRTVDRQGAPHGLDLFRDTVDLNLVGTFNTVRLAASAMAATDAGVDGERGAIVTTASIAGYEGQIGQVAYAAAKAGIIGMTIVLARVIWPRSGSGSTASRRGRWARAPGISPRSRCASSSRRRCRSRGASVLRRSSRRSPSTS